MKRATTTGLIVAIVMPAFAPIAALAQAPRPQDLTQVSLEDLMNIEVVSVSRKEQMLATTGAAVFVITQDDIRRSGAANIPDVLRMAPGVNVARIDANAWAISIRGFNSRFSDKILVLIDGRSIYSPAFSGVYWDQINVPMQDIERIEVIRGPGGTVWGANAMNGVINIITMSSRATQGGFVVAEAGSQESGALTQYGGTVGAAGTYRAFGKYSNTASSVNPADTHAADGWHALHGGFRSDWTPSSRDELMVQGDLYHNAGGQTLTTVLSNHLPTVATFDDPITVENGDLQARWTRKLQSGSDFSLNVYYNHANRLSQPVVENSDTFDVDFQHHVSTGLRNDVVLGGGYRVTNDTLTSGYNITWASPHRTDSLYSGFIQDEIRLAKTVWLTIGTKLEHNAYTGFEVQPSAQFVWMPTIHQTFWLSASRAIRQPSLQDTELRYDLAIVPLEAGTFGVVKVIGKQGIQAGQLFASEAGYRVQLEKHISLDIAAFRNSYSRLETSDLGTPYFMDTPGPPHLVFPANLVDSARARTYGGEVFATLNLTRRWRLSPGYSFILMKLLPDPLSKTPGSSTALGDSPKHQIQCRSIFELRTNLDWDTSVYFIGKLSDGQTPGYARLDMQLRWRVLESVEFSAVGQNLLTPRHAEFADAYGVDYTQVQRSVLGKVTWRF